MTDWPDGDLAPFDLETTSPDPEDARIVQWALGEHLALCNPGVPIPASATEIHGITDEHVAHVDTEWSTALVLAGLLYQFADAGVPVVGHNVWYDLTVCDRMFRRVERETGTRVRLPADLFVIDTYVLDRQIDRYRSGKRRLTETAQHYGVPLTAAHDAQADAYAAVGIAREIGRRYWRIGHTDLFVLHGLQIQWAWQQRAELQAYLRRTDPSVEVVPYWPVTPWHRRKVPADA